MVEVFRVDISKLIVWCCNWSKRGCERDLKRVKCVNGNSKGNKNGGRSVLFEMEFTDG